MRMRPLADCPRTSWRSLAGVFTDIDDTLTTDGRISAEAYGSLEALTRAGLLVVPITGRPAGWCDMIARTWPVAAVIGENGAFYFRYDTTRRQMIRHFQAPADERTRNRDRLHALGRAILRDVPGTAIAADQAYRETDLAVDFAEDVPTLDQAAIDKIVEAFETAGATAKVSSIHVNGWFGRYDKLSMTRALMAREFGVDLETSKHAYAFVGDSPNDAPMFGYFPNSVGVANVTAFAGRLPHEPQWVTKAARGAGFAEVAATILRARSAVD